MYVRTRAESFNRSILSFCVSNKKLGALQLQGGPESKFVELGVETRHFSQAGKERTACKAVQIHKMTIIFTQNKNP